MSLLSIKINSARKSSEFVDVSSVLLPTVKGIVEILPDHMPLITELDQGELEIKTTKNETIKFIVSRGYARIKDNEIVLLLDEVDQPEELVKEEIQKAIELAQNMIETTDLNPTELIQLEKKLRYEKFKLEKI